MLTLTPDDVALYQGAATALLRPFAYPSLDAWRDDVCESARAFVGGDAVVAGIPSSGPYVSSPHLSNDTLAGIKRFLEGPSLGDRPSPDPRVNAFYRELQRRGLDAVDFADVDRFTEGGLYESAVYQEVFVPAGLCDMRTLYVSTRSEDRPALAGLAVYASDPVSRSEGAQRLWKLRLLRPALEAALAVLARPHTAHGDTEHPIGSKISDRDHLERGGACALPLGLSKVEEVRTHFGLTTRQAEVAVLIAEGLSNMQIAERLSISPHTARRHTEGVMGTLLVERRSGVAGRLLGLA